MKFATEENIYKCQSCNAIQGETDLLSIRLEGKRLLRCCVCNSPDVKIHTDEPLVGTSKCDTCFESSHQCFIRIYSKKPILKCKFYDPLSNERSVK